MKKAEVVFKDRVITIEYYKLIYQNGCFYFYDQDGNIQYIIPERQILYIKEVHQK